MTKTISFILLIVFLYSCTTNNSGKGNQKNEEAEKSSVSLDDFQGFWVNVVFVDSIVPERTFAKYGYGSFFFFKSFETNGDYTFLRKGPGAGSNMQCVIEGNKIIISDSTYSYQVFFESDSMLAFSKVGDTNVIAFFKRRNNLKEILKKDDCPNNWGMYGGCGYVRFFSKMVFDGNYSVVFKKENFENSSGVIQIKDNIITGVEKKPLELYVDNYFGTIHPNGKNDAMYLVRDTAYHKNYHWYFSGDTLILHKWNSRKDSHMYDIGEIVLKMIKQR